MAESAPNGAFLKREADSERLARMEALIAELQRQQQTLHALIDYLLQITPTRKKADPASPERE